MIKNEIINKYGVKMKEPIYRTHKQQIKKNIDFSASQKAMLYDSLINLYYDTSLSQKFHEKQKEIEKSIYKFFEIFRFVATFALAILVLLGIDKDLLYTVIKLLAIIIVFLTGYLFKIDLQEKGKNHNVSISAFLRLKNEIYSQIETFKKNAPQGIKEIDNIRNKRDELLNEYIRAQAEAPNISKRTKERIVKDYDIEQF